MEIASQISVPIVLAIQSRTATPTVTALDVATAPGGPFNAVHLVVYTGPGGITFSETNSLAWRLEHSVDGVAWSAVTAGDVRGAAGQPITVGANGTVEAYTSAKSQASSNLYVYTGGRRFVRLTPVFSGTHGTGTITGALAILSGALVLPVA